METENTTVEQTPKPTPLRDKPIDELKCMVFDLIMELNRVQEDVKRKAERLKILQLRIENIKQIVEEKTKGAATAAPSVEN